MENERKQPHTHTKKKLYIKKKFKEKFQPSHPGFSRVFTNPKFQISFSAGLLLPIFHPPSLSLCLSGDKKAPGIVQNPPRRRLPFLPPPRPCMARSKQHDIKIRGPIPPVIDAMTVACVGKEVDSRMNCRSFALLWRLSPQRFVCVCLEIPPVFRKRLSPTHTHTHRERERKRKRKTPSAPSPNATSACRQKNVESEYELGE